MKIKEAVDEPKRRRDIERAKALEVFRAQIEAVCDLHKGAVPEWLIKGTLQEISAKLNYS